MSRPTAEPATDLHQTIVENLFDGVYYVDRKRTITYWNPAAERISGFGRDEVTGRSCFDGILRHVDDAGALLCRTACPLVRAMAQRRGVDAEVFLHHRDGHRVPVHVRCQPIRSADGAVIGAVEIFNEDRLYRDALSRIGTLEELASRDVLTGLPNRRIADVALRSRFGDFVDAGWPLGVLFADIDSFKALNDRHGHAAGDEVLRVVGKSLAACLRESDLAARWGGEEFVILTAASDPEQLRGLAERVRALVGASTARAASGEALQVTVSVGAALAVPGDSAESLVVRADAAMYESKRRGRDRVTLAPG